jgi:hypothetical protein
MVSPSASEDTSAGWTGRRAGATTSPARAGRSTSASVAAIASLAIRRALALVAGRSFIRMRSGAVSHAARFAAARSIRIMADHFAEEAFRLSAEGRDRAAVACLELCADMMTLADEMEAR